MSFLITISKKRPSPRQQEENHTQESNPGLPCEDEYIIRGNFEKEPLQQLIHPEAWKAEKE